MDLDYFNHLGSSVLGFYLVLKLESNYDVHCLFNTPDSSIKSRIKDYLTFPVTNGHLESPDFFLHQLNLTLLLTSQRFIIVWFSLNNSHRNVLVIDRGTQTLHYFEPNDVDDTIRNHVISTTLSLDTLKAYRIMEPIRDVHNIFLSSKINQSSRNPGYGFCSGCCYFFVLRVLKGLDFTDLKGEDLIDEVMTFTLDVILEHEEEIKRDIPRDISLIMDTVKQHTL